MFKLVVVLVKNYKIKIMSEEIQRTGQSLTKSQIIEIESFFNEGEINLPKIDLSKKRIRKRKYNVL
jgi:hypothetical protein